jgi:hypothetical protein
MCIKAPKKSIDVRNESPIVQTIIILNFLNIVNVAPYMNAPAPILVTAPLKMLMPIF